MATKTIRRIPLDAYVILLLNIVFSDIEMVSNYPVAIFNFGNI